MTYLPLDDKHASDLLDQQPLVPVAQLVDQPRREGVVLLRNHDVVADPCGSTTTQPKRYLRPKRR